MYKLPEDMRNKYAFVTLASARAEQLQRGALPRVEETERKFTVIAQEEIATGIIEEIDADELARLEAEAAAAAHAGIEEA